MRIKTLEHRGCSGTIDFSKKDNCYFGEVLNLGENLVSYEGSTLEELEKDFKSALDSYLDGKINEPKNIELSLNDLNCITKSLWLKRAILMQLETSSNAEEVKEISILYDKLSNKQREMYDNIFPLEPIPF